MLIYGDVCAGISAVSVAWHPLGMKPSFFAETDKFPSAVLKHHYVDVPNAGDFTAIGVNDYEPIDVLVGGTPCQDFSVAGLRAGMDGNRGQLTIEFARLAGRLRPRWLVWENVPGVLSIDGGRAFGLFLGQMGKLGYGFAYRVLDAQHFGVPQRRRRVFVVGHLGDWRRAAAVLFERHSLSGYPAPRRQTKEDVAGTVAASFGRRGWPAPEHAVSTLDATYAKGQGCTGQDMNHGHSHLVAYGGNNTSGPIDIATAVNACSSASGRMDFESETFVMQAGTTRENPDSGPDGVGVRTDGIAYTLEARAEVQAVAFSENIRGEVLESPISRALQTSGGKPGQGYVAARVGMAVRRLTPRECERLQGFPDDYTKISDKTADGPRYKALGNSMAVPVMRWIGERIQLVEAL